MMNRKTSHCQTQGFCCWQHKFEPKRSGFGGEIQSRPGSNGCKLVRDLFELVVLCNSSSFIMYCKLYLQTLKDFVYFRKSLL